jgi:protein SCO1
MRRAGVLVALLAVAACSAHAHDEHAAPAPPADAAASAAAAATAPKPRRDPQAYFTDRVLVTQDGRKLRFYSDVLSGRLVVLNTIYTHCEDACPLITAQLNQVRAKLGASFGKDVFFVSLSSDPARDTPQALKQYAKKHAVDVPGWTFLTGDKPDVEHILKKLGQWSGNIESHSTQLIAWNFATDRGRKMLPNVSPDMIAAQIMLLAEGDSPLPLPLPATPR